MTPNAQIYLVKLRCYGQILRLSEPSYRYRQASPCRTNTLTTRSFKSRDHRHPPYLDTRARRSSRRTSRRPRLLPAFAGGRNIFSRDCYHYLMAAAFMYRFDERIGDTITVAENLMGFSMRFSKQSSHGSLSNRRAFHAVSVLTLLHNLFSLCLPIIFFDPPTCP